MRFKPFTEKNKKKKIGICSILGRIRIHHPGSGSADSDPHQNDTDPKHDKNAHFSYRVCMDLIETHPTGSGWITPRNKLIYFY